MDDRAVDFVLGQDRERAESASERERADVAHEDARRIGVEPEEADARAGHRRAEDGELAGALDVRDEQVVGDVEPLDHQSGEVREQEEGERADDGGPDGEPVEPVGQVDRVAGADDDDEGEREVQPPGQDRAEGAHLDEGNGQARIEQQVRMQQPAPPVDEEHRDHAQEDQRLPEELLAAGQALRVALGELQPVVGEPDQAVAEREHQRRPHQPVRQIGEEKGADQQRPEDQPAAHGRRAALLLVRRGRVLADVGCAVLLDAHRLDVRGAEEEAHE